MKQSKFVLNPRISSALRIAPTRNHIVRQASDDNFALGSSRGAVCPRLQRSCDGNDQLQNNVFNCILVSILVDRPSLQRLAMPRSAECLSQVSTPPTQNATVYLMIPCPPSCHFHFFVLISFRAELLCLITADTSLSGGSTKTKSRASKSTNKLQFIP